MDYVLVALIIITAVISLISKIIDFSNIEKEIEMAEKQFKDAHSKFCSNPNCKCKSKCRDCKCQQYGEVLNGADVAKAMIKRKQLKL